MTRHRAANVLGATCLAFVITLAPRPASASMLGSTAACSVLPAGLWRCSTPTAVVDAGNEFGLELGDLGTYFEVDVDASSIDIRLVGDRGLTMNVGERLRLSHLLPPTMVISRIAVETVGEISGLEIADVSYGPQSVAVDLNGSVWNAGDRATLQLVFSPVPEPSTVCTLTVALTALYIFRTRRRSSWITSPRASGG